MSAFEPTSPASPVEDVNRGTVVALLAIPLGVIVWTVVWSFGFIVSIITFGIAYLAMFLYKLGSRGVIGRAGAIRVTIITLVALALSIFAGLVSDVAIGVGRVAGITPVEALNHPDFWAIFNDYVTSGDGGLLLNLGIAILFGILGCFGVLRNAFRATAAPQDAVAQTPWPTLPSQQDPAAPPAAVDPQPEAEQKP